MTSIFGRVSLPLLNKSFGYYVFIHEPKFFFLSTNPKAHPGVELFIPSQKGNSSYDVYTRPIEIVKHSLLNLRNSPCEEDTQYDFSLCVRNYINTNVGCKVPWQFNPEGVNNFPDCRILDDFNKNADFYESLAYLEQKDVINQTNCKIPCHYREIVAVRT